MFGSELCKTINNTLFKNCMIQHCPKEEKIIIIIIIIIIILLQDFKYYVWHNTACDYK